MFKPNLRSILLPLFATASCLVATNGSLLASDNCKDVVITISNKTSDEIRVKTFEYRDFDKEKWKTEVMFGIDGHQDLEEGKAYTFNSQNLESVLDDKTEFRVTYAHHIGGNKWGLDKTETTGTFTCTVGMKKTVSITK
jgi:hypothetical protein